MFLQSLDRADEGMRYMQQFFLNATVSLSVIALLAPVPRCRYSSSTPGFLDDPTHTKNS